MFDYTNKNYKGKVKISKALFLHIVSLLEEIDIEDYPDLAQLYGYVLFTLKNKKAALEPGGSRPGVPCEPMCFCCEDVPF